MKGCRTSSFMDNDNGVKVDLFNICSPNGIVLH